MARFLMFAVTLWGFAGCWDLLATCRAEDQERPDDKKSVLAVGGLVPISSMRCVVGEPRDRNTCLAGKYRQQRVISIYAHSAAEPRLADLCRRINAVVGADTELRGYVLLFDGNQFDEGYKARMRAWSKEHSLDKLDLATAHGNAKHYDVAAETGVTVVFSDKREIKFRRDIAAGRIDQAAIDELVKDLATVAR